jgi:hypothetical protein
MSLSTEELNGMLGKPIIPQFKVGLSSTGTGHE